MKLNLLYFAWLRTRIGRAEERLTAPDTIADVAGLLDWLSHRSGSHADALRDLSVVRVAVNNEYVQHDHAIKPDDRIALFPPTVGG